jgi:hypothetical protein
LTNSETQPDPVPAQAEIERVTGQARMAVSEMHSAGGVTTGMTSAVDKANDGIDQITTLNDTWQPLLGKLKIFTELVDKIAEV